MTARPHIGFLLERSLGHVAHAETMTRLLARQEAITSDVAQIDFGIDGATARIPVFNSNWTVRAGVRARQAIRRMHRMRPLDALIIHTQVPAVLVPDWVGKLPTVVSLDATPLQYDKMGDEYRHQVGTRTAERMKWRLNRACLNRARRVVTWSRWAMDGVVDGYRIDASKVSVIPPGVDLDVWQRATAERDGDGIIRILFVGGDFERKGGDVLLEAFQTLRQELQSTGGVEVRLDLVTGAPVRSQPGVDVHNGMTPNQPALIALYHRADIFAFPTRADCLSVALIEAGAAELPLIGTHIAGMPDLVRQGQTGLVVPPGDRAALVHALRTLIEQPTLRQQLGAGARKLVADRFDATTNTDRLVELLVDVAREAKRSAR